MAQRVSNTAVGGFIVGSFVLIIAATIVFGSGHIFHTRQEMVCFFQGSLNGLKVGAPVKFRGVQIGSVTNIRVRLPIQPTLENLKAGEMAMPVFFELDQEQLGSLGAIADVGKESVLRMMISRGLRAQLQTESILTGLLFVELDFHADTQPHFALPADSGYREIPTIPTSMQQIQQKAMEALARFEEIDFQALIDSVTGAAKATRDLAASPDLKGAIVELRETAAGLKVAVTRISGITENLDRRMDPLIASLTKTSDQANATLVGAQNTLAEMDGALDPGNPLGFQLSQALMSLTDAGRSLSELADYLQRNPSALVRGKAGK